MKGKSPLLFSEKKLELWQKKGMEKGERSLFMKCWIFKIWKYVENWGYKKKEKAVGQVVRNLLYNLSSKLLLFLLLLFWSWFRNHHPSFPLFPCMSLRCCNHKTDCNLWKSTTRLVHSMTRKLAFAPHVISLKRGQDEWEFFDSIHLCIIYFGSILLS